MKSLGTDNPRETRYRPDPLRPSTTDELANMACIVGARMRREVEESEGLDDLDDLDDLDERARLLADAAIYRINVLCLSYTVVLHAFFIESLGHEAQRARIVRECVEEAS